MAELAAAAAQAEESQTCQATAPGALVVLQDFNSPTFYFHPGWYEALALVHQIDKPANESSGWKVRFWVIDSFCLKVFVFY